MIIYNVIVTISNDVESEWVKWMKEVHIPDVIKTGYFFDWQISRRIVPEDEIGETTYTIIYIAKSLEEYKKYIEKDAPRLQNEHNLKFGGKFKASRMVTSVLSK